MPKINLTLVFLFLARLCFSQIDEDSLFNAMPQDAIRMKKKGQFIIGMDFSRTKIDYANMNFAIDNYNTSVQRENGGSSFNLGLAYYAPIARQTYIGFGIDAGRAKNNIEYTGLPNNFPNDSVQYVKSIRQFSELWVRASIVAKQMVTLFNRKFEIGARFSIPLIKTGFDLEDRHYSSLLSNYAVGGDTHPAFYKDAKTQNGLKQMQVSFSHLFFYTRKVKFGVGLIYNKSLGYLKIKNYQSLGLKLYLIR